MFLGRGFTTPLPHPLLTVYSTQPRKDEPVSRHLVASIAIAPTPASHQCRSDSSRQHVSHERCDQRTTRRAVRTYTHTYISKLVHTRYERERDSGRKGGNSPQMRLCSFIVKCTSGNNPVTVTFEGTHVPSTRRHRCLCTCIRMYQHADPAPEDDRANKCMPSERSRLVKT